MVDSWCGKSILSFISSLQCPEYGRSYSGKGALWSQLGSLRSQAPRKVLPSFQRQTAFHAWDHGVIGHAPGSDPAHLGLWDPGLPSLPSAVERWTRGLPRVQLPESTLTFVANLIMKLIWGRWDPVEAGVQIWGQNIEPFWRFLAGVHTMHLSNSWSTLTECVDLTICEI